ncbi:hypothetical protein Trihar35433_269 [Trichoderma harzianum]|nr:hypothetical protein Trihar35433_269 [Trichoderma harzianum]
MVPRKGVSLTQVHPSPGADAETDIDIIAIHGLDTKSPDTWVWKSKSPDEDVNWLASPHMLPGRVGCARIFMCDWPADLFEQPDLIQKTTKVFARLLLAGIKRRSLPKTGHKEKDRPIVFIASCLGGIILMKALLIADHPPSEYTAIRQSTRGVVFLATPFRGTSFQDVANWAEPGLRAWALIRGQKVSSLLDSVKGSTFHLEELVRRFTQLCQDKRYPCQVTTFYEMGKTSLHRKFPLSWLIPSPLVNQLCRPKPLVDVSSSTLDIVPHPLPLDRSHVMMNKFEDPEDPNFKLVVEQIERFLQDIRANSPLDDADAWICNKHYTAERLKIERLSGDLLSMDQCYINLAVVEHHNQNAGRPIERRETPSQFSLFHRQKVETPEKSIQVELATIFNQRNGRDGKLVQPRRIFIRGRAGVGKTTLCKKIVYEFIQGTWSEWNNLFDRILWVPLRNLKLKERHQIAGYNFEQLFAHEYFSLSSDKLALATELLKELETNSSKTLFLLDGLDEVSQDLGEGSMSVFLNELLKQPNVIVTSRPSSKMPLDMDLELETIGFYPDQVKDYIKRVFTDPKTAKSDTETISKIQSFLQNHWLIQGLVRIPIQLDALCYSWKDIHGDMLETMTALYQAIELSLWKKDILRLKKSHGQDPVTLDHIQDASRSKIEGFVNDEIYFLESLAFTGLHDDVIEFEPKHLNRISDSIRNFLPDKAAPCLSFLRTSNLSFEGGNRSYHFIHLTFQEYFAARYFVRQWIAGEPLNCLKLCGSGKIGTVEPVKFFQKHKYTARYDIMWRFVAGLLDSGKKELLFFPQTVEGFFQIIEEEPLDFLGPAHQRLVMHCLGEISSDLPIRNELEQRLSKWLLFECQFSRNTFSYLARDEEFPERALGITFRETSDYGKEKIIRSLSNRAIIPVSIVKQVASWLEHNEFVPYTAIQALAKFSLPEEILNSVVGRLQYKDKSIQEAAVSALAWRALPQKILKDLTPGLKDHDRSIRKAAVEILGLQTAVPSEILKDIAARLKDNDRSVREAAVNVLSRRALPDKILKDIIAGLTDEGWSFPNPNVEVLSQQALPDKILEDIVARLKDESWRIRDAAFEILGQQTALPSEILKDIAARLKDNSRSVRDAAVSVLSRQALPDKVLKDIVVGLKDEDWDIRRAAGDILYWQALPEKIMEDIAAGFKDENPHIRVAAVNALRQKALPDKILKEIAGFKNKDCSIQHSAARVLGQQTTLPSEILEDIAAQLNDESATVRLHAAMALGGQTAMPNEVLKALAALAARYDDNSVDTRMAAIEALNRQITLSNDILRAIAAQLNDNDESIREAAIRVLGRHTVLPDDTLKAIVARLDDNNRSIREVTVKILDQQTALSDDILRTITARLDDYDISIRQAAIEALGRQTALPDDSLRAITMRLDSYDSIQKAVINVLSRQTVLPDKILRALAARLEDKTEFVRYAAESAIRRHGEFYSTLFRGPYLAPLYDILIRKSFEEHLSWYIDDGYACINSPEGIMKLPIDEHNEFRAVLKKAQPANFPAR